MTLIFILPFVLFKIMTIKGVYFGSMNRNYKSHAKSNCSENQVVLILLQMLFARKTLMLESDKFNSKLKLLSFIPCICLLNYIIIAHVLSFSLAGLFIKHAVI
jgi:hypothetical protein